MDALELTVNGMTCASCVGTVRRVLSEVPGVDGVEVHPETGSATVQGEAITGKEHTLIAALNRAGYGAHIKGARRSTESNHQSRKGCGSVSATAGHSGGRGCCCGN